MNGLAFVRALPTDGVMPMGSLFSFRLSSAEYGTVTATAVPQEGHGNPFGVVQGGFAATVLDMVLGLVSISVLTEDASSVGTTDLSVRYIRPLLPQTGIMTIHGSIIHVGKTVVVTSFITRGP